MVRKTGSCRAGLISFCSYHLSFLFFPRPLSPKSSAFAYQDVQEYYLEVKQYPVIRLDSTGIQKSERPHSLKEPWQITLKGRLELHGVQREVIVPVRLLYQTNKIIAQGSFRLLLEEFNITVPRLLFLKSGNQVEVDFSIVGERQP